MNQLNLCVKGKRWMFGHVVKSNKRVRGALAFAAVMAHGHVMANQQSAALPSPAPEPPGWTFALGAGVTYGPKYIGSSERKVQVFPFVVADFKDLFYVHGATIGYNAMHSDSFTVSVAGRYQMYGGRNVRDDDRLKGLENINRGFDLGVVTHLDLNRWSFELSVFKDVSGTYDGSNIQFDVDRTFKLTDKLQTQVGLSFTWGDRNIQQTYFGITPLQSQASGLRRYEAGAGLMSAGLGFGMRYAFDKNWQILGKLDLDRLLGDAAGSPIAQELGSTKQPRLTMILGYKF